MKPVKEFLEFYFDHTALISADDPRVEKAVQAHEDELVDLRILPYGVSMEMSSIFIWEQVNPFISSVTDGRSYISRVECREHEKNSAFIEIEEKVALKQGKLTKRYLQQYTTWRRFVKPSDILKKYAK